MSTDVTVASSAQGGTTEEELQHLQRNSGSGKQRAGRILAYIGMALIVLYCILPFYWMVVSSLRLPTMGRSTDLIPNPASVENYAAVFAPGNNFARSLLNSLIVSGVTTVLTLVLGILGAYALARLRFALKGIVLGIIIACSMFPQVTLLIPLLKMFTGTYEWLPLNWMNTYQALILPSLSFALPLCVWNLTAFFRQLPVELEYAAMVDGCGPMQAFFRVILPLAAPGVFTTAIITFIAVWNEFMIALTFGQDKDMNTATVAISKFTGATGFDTPYGTIMAAGVIVTVPLIIAVLLFQRRIVAGLTAGGVK
ncbi:carbohydrate ABC transporter permease [Enemella evansiae]|uniref:carbohydrate ABC transporter permease n=1 Tax=Enemella evansiae TaxID=2016499 RepID=UPI000B97A8BE|nr:sugar ABC transporter permease [Enemella evansiae]OYO06298.1 sugar ABC transporter permease [Enemella evansiae]OYO07163.1 sugar ABC transporter permease [Enemella evansiae]TDO88042.1 carbohydrate ABC transporter membrane protein 2 (CUT1 family) [Enemella evansiae]